VHRRWATVDAQTNVVSGCERRMKIADCMTRDVITLSPEESCLRARTVMEAAGVKRLPILEDGRLVGIVTDGDLLRRVPHAPDCRDPRGSQEELLPHVKVGGVMTYAPLTASATMPIDEAAALMRKHRINTLPVVGEGMRLVGILTMEDVLRACQMPSRSR
jgi:acetoin utilization protein AcuB